MKIAILGGSFNPIHNGHLALADAVLKAFQYDRVILIPSFHSPFKTELKDSSAQDRLDMTAAAISGNPHFTLDDCEVRREGLSYTIDTLDYIDKKYRPEGKIGLIIGDDLAEDFHKWRRAEEIAERTDIILARRISRDGVAFPYPHKRLKNEIVELSSGIVRERIKNRGSWYALVPREAAFIIAERGLYGNPEAPNPYVTLIGRVEDHVRTLVPFGRFLHSRNTALLAYDLCRHFGCDPYKGYLAGISHDMCKTMGDGRISELAQRDGQGISKIEQKKLSLMHGRAAAVYLQEYFDVHDEDILEAVRLHTYASDSMGALAKIVYITDKIEVGREGIDPKMRDFGKYKDLDTLFEIIFDENVAYLHSKNLVLSDGTIRLMEAIKKRRGL